MSEHRVKVEKGTLLGTALILISVGADRLMSGNVESGALMVGLGLLILFAREHFKFHRWSSMASQNSYWKGKPETVHKGGM